MPSHDRRAADRRRAWGRGPVILKLEPLEGRQLLAASPVPRPDAVATSFQIPGRLDWGDTFQATGAIENRGDAPIAEAFEVAIYASPKASITRGAVLLGQVTVPAGLKPGETFHFDQSLDLPPTPFTGGTASKSVYVALRVDPWDKVSESDEVNNEGIGTGVDTSAVTIAKHTPAELIGTSLGLDATSVKWGDTVTVTTQVKNDSAGEAPATRARVVLTKAEATPGGGDDFTIGSISIPAVAGWQSTNVVASVKLPDLPPAILQGGSQYLLSIVQDADFQTDQVSPHKALQGLGRDMAVLTIASNAPATTTTTGTTDANGNTTTTTTTTTTPSAVTPAILPDLAVGGVSTESGTLDWGYRFLASAAIQNVSSMNTGPFRVRFYLTGVGGSLDRSLFLGDAIVDGLKAGEATVVSQSLKLPSRFPGGLSLESTGAGRIAVVIDPENTFDEALKSNNGAGSAPVTLRVLGTDGKSTEPAVLPAVAKAQQRAQARLAGNPKAQERRLAQLAKGSTNESRRRRLAAIDKENHTLEHRLKVFPKKVGDFFSDLFN